MMCADVLNKPKQGQPSRLDRSFVMNVPVDYDNTEELLQTHDDLLPDSDRTLKKVILLRQRLQAQLFRGVCWVIARIAKPACHTPRLTRTLCAVPTGVPSEDPISLYQ